MDPKDGPDLTTSGAVAHELELRMAALDLMNEAAAIANEADSYSAALQAVVDAVCVHLGWHVGHVYEVPADPDPTLMPTPIWHLSDPEKFETFRKITESTPLASGEGLPGRVFAAQSPLWISDVTTDPNFPRARLADDLGVKSATGFPVLVGGNVVSVLEFFSDSLRQPEVLLDEVMRHIGTQLSHVKERESAAAALRLSEEQARLVVETANDAFVGIDSRSVITDWNSKAAEVFGWERSEAVGRSLTETIIPEQYREAHKAGLKNFLETGEGPVLFNRIEIIALHKDRTEFPVELTIWPIKTPDGFIFNAFVRDITERKRLEAQLSQSQKMDAIGQLAGGVAHDFNNLLAVIQSYAGFVADEVKDMEAVSADVAEIINACERATGLTRQLLRLSRSDVARPEVADLNDVVGSARNLLKRTLPETISLTADLDPDVWPVLVDPSQFELVIMNLVVNARDAMPKGGAIEIRTGNFTLDSSDSNEFPGMAAGEYARLSVIDQGSGMSAETIEHIFEPFFTTKEREQGTGLGLATVYGIVKQSEGFVFVTSELDRGSDFSVYLPRSSERAALPQVVEAIDPGPSGGLVLLVEDQHGVRKVVSRMLKKRGFTVLEASSPRKALELAKTRGPFDLLLTDVVMPEMSGRELAVHVAALQEDLRILYMSGYTDRVIAEFGLLTVDESYIQKPFNEAQLMEAITEVTRERGD